MALSWEEQVRETSHHKTRIKNKTKIKQDSKASTHPLFVSSSTYCELILCGEPPSIAFGKIVVPVKHPTVGARGTYHCFPGFRIVGSSGVECSWRGLWEGKVPHCVPVACPTPQAPEHGAVEGEDFSFQVGCVDKLVFYKYFLLKFKFDSIEIRLRRSRIGSKLPQVQRMHS